jgi:hypothetical protein
MASFTVYQNIACPHIEKAVRHNGDMLFLACAELLMGKQLPNLIDFHSLSCYARHTPD